MVLRAVVSREDVRSIANRRTSWRRACSLSPARSDDQLGKAEILDLTCPDERNDVVLNPAGVRGDRRRLLWSPAFSKDKPRLGIGEIAGAQLLYPDRLVIKLTIFSRMIP